LIGLLILAAVAHPEEEKEEWNLEKEGKLEATLLSYRNGVVILQKEGGQKMLLQIEKFTPEDRERIRERFPEGDRTEKRRTPPPGKESTLRELQPENLSKKGNADTPPRKPLPHLRNTSIGDYPPDFSVTVWGDPKPIEFESFRGDLVLVYFWSPDSEGSVNLLPFVAKINEVYGPLGLKVVSIAVDSRRPLVKSIEKQHEVTWPSATDRGKKIAEAWGIQMLPTFVLVSQSWIIVSDNTRADEIQGEIRQYLGLPAVR